MGHFPWLCEITRGYQKCGQMSAKKKARFEKTKSFFGDKTFLMTDRSWWKPIPRGVRPGFPGSLVASLLATWTLSPVQLQELSPIQLNFVQTAVWWLARLPTPRPCLKNLWRTPSYNHHITIYNHYYWSIITTIIGWKLVQSSTTRWAIPFKSSIWDHHLGMIFGGATRSSNGIWERMETRSQKQLFEWLKTKTPSPNRISTHGNIIIEFNPWNQHILFFQTVPHRVMAKLLISSHDHPNLFWDHVVI